MNILGVGPGEVIVIFIILLVVAGPKRMLQWAYHIGRYTAQLRTMFQETMNVIQKELAESGVEVPKELADLQKGGFDIVREASRIINEEPSPTPTGLTPPASTVANTPTPIMTPTPTSEPTPEPTTTPATPDTPPPDDVQPGSDSNTQPDNDKPRYDAWTLN